MSNIHLVTLFFENKFPSHEFLDSVVMDLKIWVKLNTFINITTIEDNNIYKEQLDSFEQNLKDFYTIGGESFLTKGQEIGDDETFYMHCLKCYIPRIARKTYDNHHLGISIFTM